MDARLNGTGWGELPKQEVAVITPNLYEDYPFTDMDELTQECLKGIEKSRLRNKRRRAREENNTSFRVMFIGLWVLLFIASAIIGGLQ